MADIVTLGDVSTKDTGSGSQLKTGGRRKHNMAQKCKTGTVWSLELKKCVPGKKLKPPGREGLYKYKSPKQRARELIVGPIHKPRKSMKEKIELIKKQVKGNQWKKGKKLTKKEMREIIRGPMPSPKKIKKRLKKRLKS